MSKGTAESVRSIIVAHKADDVYLSADELLILEGVAYRLEADASQDQKYEALQDIGKCTYASIVEMVEALECDYDRLEELKEGKKATGDAFNDSVEEYLEACENVKRHHAGVLSEDTQYPEVREMLELRKAWHDAIAEYEQWAADNTKELTELTEAAGECTSREEAEQRIHEDALSVEVRTGWYTLDGNSDRVPEEFNILLGTSGPATRIIGELDESGEPTRARLQAQDWGTAWTDYRGADQDVLLTYARCFYFGEG